MGPAMATGPGGGAGCSSSSIAVPSPAGRGGHDFSKKFKLFSEKKNRNYLRMSLSARYDSSASCGGGGGDDDGGIAAKLAPRVGPLPCFHCRTAQAVVRSRADHYCRLCFLATCLSRTRKLMTHPLLVGSRVLLGVSGGASSLAALDVASLLLHSGRRRRWWAEGAVVHIDTSALWECGFFGVGARGGSEPSGEGGGGGAERALPSPALLSTCLASGLHTYIVPLEAAFTPCLLVLPIAAPTIALGDAGIAPAPPSGAQLNAALPFSPLRDTAAPALAAAVAQALGTLAGEKAAPTLTAARARLRAAFEACGALHPSSTHSASLDGRGGGGGGGAPAHGAPRPAARVPPRDACQALLRALLTRLLVETAAALQFPYLATAASLDTVAFEVFTAMTCRSGAAVPSEVAAVDERFWGPGGLPFLPSREGPARALGATGGGGAPSSSSSSSGSGSGALAALPSNWYNAVLQDKPGSGSSGVVVGGGGGAGSAGAASPGGGVVIVRVAQEVEAREAALVCRFKGLTGCSLACTTFLSFPSPFSSVAVKCRDVLVGLQSQFPSTLHNVVKTAKKLKGGSAAAGGAGRCSCCGALLARGASGSGSGGGRCGACESLPLLSFSGGAE